MNYLVDTNVFLEILLSQAGRAKCEAFLESEDGAAWISDFSLHSVGVLLFRKNRPQLFKKFVNDTLPQFTVLSLDRATYAEVIQAGGDFALDFDDAYQFCVAAENHLHIATQDKDFARVKPEIGVKFI